MQERFSFAGRILSALRWPRGAGGDRGGLLALLTPPSTNGRGAIARIALAGGTVAAMGLAAAIGVVAFGALLCAVAVIWFLATRVLGIEIDFDPRAFYEQMQRQAAAAGYGPN